MALSKPTFDSVRLGNDRNAFTVQLLPFPRSDGPLLEKVQAFAFFEEILEQHRSQLSSAAIQQAYATNIPVSSSASASEEANRVCREISNAFFHIDNLTCLGFFKSDGTEASVAFQPCDRASDISFIKFQAMVSPATFSSALVDTPQPTVQFFFKLPQSLPPAKPSSATAPADPNSSPTQEVTNGSLNTPDTVNVSAIRKAFASGGDPSSVDLTDPLVLNALTSIIKTSTADKELDTLFSPGSTKRQLFASGSSGSTTAAASPSIRRYLTTAASSAQPTFCGPLDFLDSQCSFDSVFPPASRIPIFSLLVTPHPSSLLSRSLESSDNAIELCLSACRLLVFKAMLRIDYIGHHNLSSADHLHMTVKRIRFLSLKFNVNGRVLDGNPDMLFDKYLALIPLLPATHVNIWGINLFSQFWSALGEDLTRRISQLPRYVAIAPSLFDLTTMSTKARQMTALRELRSLAVESWSSLQDDKRSMRAMFRELSTSNRTSSHFTESSSNVSSAEATMQRYTPDEPPATPAIQTNYQHPAPPSTSERVSDYPADFRGCLGCGGSEHVFRSCPMKNDPVTIDRFHRNFNIKFNRPDRPPPDRAPRHDTAYSSSRTSSPYGPSTSPSSAHTPPAGRPPAFSHNSSTGAGRGSQRNQPAWMSQQHHSRTSAASPTGPVDTNPSPPKKARNFPLFVRSLQNQVSTSPALRPMPIRVDNGLPHLRLNLGLSSDATLSVLFDSGAALSSGYLPYHLWIMRENPDIVASFERFDDSNPFEPIKLGGAIRHPDDYNESMHGQLTAIIRYKTPYVDTAGNPIRISFGLGNDMTVNTILGMPIIKDLGMIPNFRAGTVTCEDSPATFSIRYQETSCGFLASDAPAAAFSALPVADMYPSILPPTPSPSEPDPEASIAATDDLTKGFLQRNLN